MVHDGHNIMLLRLNLEHIKLAVSPVLMDRGKPGLAIGGGGIIHSTWVEILKWQATTLA